MVYSLRKMGKSLSRLDEAHQDAILARPAKVVHEHGPIYVLEGIAGRHIVGHGLMLRNGIRTRSLIGAELCIFDSVRQEQLQKKSV